MAGSKEIWFDIPQVITDRTKRRSYRFDIRDHGDSEWAGNFSFNMAVQDAIYFLESKNITRAILIGFSMGGWVASMVALKKPEKVELLISEDMYLSKVFKKYLDIPMSHMVLVQKAVENIPKELNEIEGTKFAVDYIYDKIPPHQQRKFTKKEHLYKCIIPIKRRQDGSYTVNHNVKGILSSAADVEIFAEEPKGTFTGPTYVIWGELSNMKVGENKAIVLQHFPCAELILFEGATHYIHVEFPDKFTETVVECILKHS